MKTLKSIVIGVSLLTAAPAFAALGDYSANSAEERLLQRKGDESTMGDVAELCPTCTTPWQRVNAHEKTKAEIAQGYDLSINGKEAKDTSPANAVQEKSGGG